jgi:hypothetical protein
MVWPYIPLVLSPSVRDVSIIYILLHSNLFWPAALYSSCSVASVRRIYTDMSIVKTWWRATDIFNMSGR